MGCCHSHTQKRYTEYDTPLRVTRKVPQEQYVRPHLLHPVNEGDDTFMIFIKGQFGRTIEVHGLKEDTKISDIKRNIEINYGIPPSKLARGGLLDRRDTKEEEIGFKNGTLNFPKDLTLKELNIKANDVIFWTSFHDKYMKQIEYESIVDDNIHNNATDRNADDAKNDYNQYSYETIINLSELIGSNMEQKNEALEAMGHCLEQRGFCFIQYPEDIKETLMNSSKNILRAIDEIDVTQHELPQGWVVKYEMYDRDRIRYYYNTETERRVYKIEDIKPTENIEDDATKTEWKEILQHYGYFYHPKYKQSLRALTGKFWEKYRSEYPEKVREDIECIAGCLDHLCNEIIDVGFEVDCCWKNIENTLLNEITLTKDDMKCGMIDFVKYLNYGNQTDSEYHMIRQDKMNVSSHTDPGLFSLSFISTNTGLELFDLTTKQWVESPLNYGLLFCGETMPYVTDGRLKSAIHRVRFDDQNKSRFTGWYEVNATHQIDYQTKREAFDST